MRCINIFKMANICWVQFDLSLNNLQWKTGTGLHKPVKLCKSLMCWEVKQLPQDLSHTFFRELFYLPTLSAFTVFMPPGKLKKYAYIQYLW